MEGFVAAGDLRIRVVEEGPRGGVAVVLVHGYPDDLRVWDRVAGRLRERFRVVRFDLPGAGRSGVPAGRDGYRVERLAEGLLRVAGEGPVHLVGHDWGSVIGWHAVSRCPERFLSFTSISGPDLGHVADWVRRHRRHPVRVANLLRKSWYIAGFKVPVVPELVWRVPRVRRAVGGEYRTLVNGLELYRANVGSAPPPRRTSVRVQQVELTQDPYVGRGHLDAALPWVDDLTRTKLVAGHWAPRTHPEHVARLVEEFIAGKPRKRLVVVTGAGSGIGRATALKFAREGAEVVALDVDLAKARETVGEGHAYELDVRDGAATRRVAEVVVARHGVPDVVIANATLAPQTSEEDWKRVVDVNLWGVVHPVRAFAPHLVERRQGGNVVVTASAGYPPTAAPPACSTADAALLMLARCLAAEMGPHGIAVSAICPGPVDSNITVRLADDVEQDDGRRHGPDPEKVAEEVFRAVEEDRTVTAGTGLARLANRVAPGLARRLGRITRPPVALMRM